MAAVCLGGRPKTRPITRSVNNDKAGVSGVNLLNCAAFDAQASAALPQLMPSSPATTNPLLAYRRTGGLG